MSLASVACTPPIDHLAIPSYDASTLMTFRNNFAPASAAPRRYTRRSGALGLLVLIALIFCFLYLGRWLIVEDPLDRAQAIAVLSGRMPMRVLEAAKLYRAGYAPEVWLTHSTEPGKSLQKMGVKYLGEEDYDREILVHEGVPPAAIHVLEPPILNTADEIVAIKFALNAAPLRTVIIVTSKPHTRRVHALWRVLTHGDGRIIVRAASLDPFDAQHWWRNTTDALDVVREVLGLLNAWAGQPVRHW
jgi:uncharacterized SAM-binding protein YcdF (DUF218 family)